MINRTKQIWEVGHEVKVGFLRLKVLAKVPTPGDYMPDKYLLGTRTSKEDRFYTFTPHNGIERIDKQEAERLWNENTEFSPSLAVAF
jgi:hypothetical protein